MLKPSQKEQADARDAALAAEHGSDQAEPENEDDDDTIATATPKSSKTARAYAKTYKPGPPLVPHIIVQRLLQYISKVVIRQKEKFVLMVCRYWSLKREARRGAPLLKRLHLEPWTASSGSRQQGEEDKALKLEVAFYSSMLRSCELRWPYFSALETIKGGFGESESIDRNDSQTRATEVRASRCYQRCSFKHIIPPRTRVTDSL